MHHLIEAKGKLMATISIVIPAHNEAENIWFLIGEIRAIGLECEIVVVDDASSDETYSTLQRLKAAVPQLKTIRHAVTYGQSAALVTGIKNSVGELIVTMDGDGQNNPADIPKMVAAILRAENSKLRMVAGYRRKRNDPSWRIICSRLANFVRNLFLKDATPDTGCGLKVFYRSAFLELPFFDHMHRFLPALIQMQGGEVISMEVAHRPRLHGISKYGTLNRLWVGIFDLVGVGWLRLRTKEVKIARCD